MLSRGLRRFLVGQARVRRRDRTRTSIRGKIERFRIIKGLGHHVCSLGRRGLFRWRGLIPEVRSPSRLRLILSFVRVGRAGSLATNPCCCCPFFFEIQQESVNISDFLFSFFISFLFVVILCCSFLSLHYTFSLSYILFSTPFLPRSFVHLPIPRVLFPSFGLSTHFACAYLYFITASHHLSPCRRPLS